MIRSIGLVKTCVCQVLSKRLYCVPMHWDGRSVVCAGESCERCAWRTPRLMWFVGLSFNGARGVYEVPDSFRRCVEQSIQTGYSPTVLGTVLGVGRATTRDEWSWREARHAELSEPQVHEAEIAGAVASVYRLSKPLVGETFVEWFERARVCVLVPPAEAQRPLHLKHDGWSEK